MRQSNYKGERLHGIIEKWHDTLFLPYNDPEPEITCDQQRASARAWRIVFIILIILGYALFKGLCYLSQL
jgi:hypothetical protein